MRVLQLCNVGRITGGTAACAWSVTRALPDCEHTILFRSRVCDETRQAFEGHDLGECKRLTVQELRRRKADVVILHNTPPSAVGWKCASELAGILSMQYVHSAGGSRAEAGVVVGCSHFLQSQLQRHDMGVLYQGVPVPEKSHLRREARSGMFVIGRICTPIPAKWPQELPQFYKRLADRFPECYWEFVGCPESLRVELDKACVGRCDFYPAGFEQRTRYHHWDAMLYHNPNITESFGRTVAEAMRCGAVPVVDCRGGFCEQIPEGTGFLCPRDDDFGKALEDLLDRQTLERRSLACQEYADNEFSLRRFRTRLLDSLENAGL